MTFLITGATGSVGRHVVDLLVAAGAPVRALTRTPDSAVLPDAVEVVAGDLLRPDSLLPALTGVERLYLFPEPSTAAQVARLAAQAGYGGSSCSPPTPSPRAATPTTTARSRRPSSGPASTGPMSGRGSSPPTS